MQHYASDRKRHILESYRKPEAFIKWVIIIAGIIMSGVIVYNITYTQIPFPWKVAISTFILLLPFSLFLQASLNVSGVKEEKIAKYQSKLRKKYADYVRENPKDIGEENIPDEEVSDEEVKYRIEKKMAPFLLKEKDGQELYAIYQKAFRNYEESRHNLEDEKNDLFLKEKDAQELDSIYCCQEMDVSTRHKKLDEILNPKGSGTKFENIQNFFKKIFLINFRRKQMKLKVLKKLKELQKQEIRHKAYLCRFLKFEIGSYLDEIVHIHMMEAGIDFRSYLVPLSFFMFMYFTGFLVIIPLINSVFTGKAVQIMIPLNFIDVGGIPLLVIQWGFLGGLVYTSIDLLNRFLRRDLSPRVYFNASFRLILSAVVAIIVYFIYLIPAGYTNGDKTPPAGLLLLVFLIGIAPIQFLIRFADTYLSKLNPEWKRRSTAGNRPIIQLEGINSVTAGRLSEEGIDYIQQMALCNPNEIAFKTNFPLSLVNDWKEQAILHLLSGDVILTGKNTLSKHNSRKYIVVRTLGKINNLLTKKDKENSKQKLPQAIIADEKHPNINTSENQIENRSGELQTSKENGIIYLNDFLYENLGIRTISDLIVYWEIRNNKEQKGEEKYFSQELEKNVEDIDNLSCLLENIMERGKLMISDDSYDESSYNPTGSI